MLRRHWYEDVPPQIVLLDFGGAAFARGANKTKLRGNVGTKFYSAPEVVSRKEYGAKADVWSVGVTLMVLSRACPRRTGSPRTGSGSSAARFCDCHGARPRFGRLVATMLVPVPETRPSATAALSSAAWLLGDGRMMSWRAAKEAQVRSKKEGLGRCRQGPRQVLARHALAPIVSHRISQPAAPSRLEPRRPRRRAGSRPGRRRRQVGRMARRSDPSSPGTTWSPRGRNRRSGKESTVHWTFPKSASDPTPAMPPRRPSIDQELHGAARRCPDGLAQEQVRARRRVRPLRRPRPR